MKLALYLPTFREHVTVGELEELTDLAEELDYDSIWTLDRPCVPVASDNADLKYSFGMMKEFPKQLPVSSRGKWFQGWPILPWLAARTEKARFGMSITDTPYRSSALFAAECATIDHLSGGRLNVGVGAGWMVEEFEAVGFADRFDRRHAHVRETIEICIKMWTNETFAYDGEFSSFKETGFGHAPVQKPHPPIFMSGLRNPEISAKRVAEFNLSGWIGIQDTPRELKEWRGPIGEELDKVGKSIDDLIFSSMIWFAITDEPTDQSDQGKASNILVGTAEQLTEKLIEYKDAGLDMPLLWPPFEGVPTKKTLEDMRQLSEEIMPQVEAA